jgi:hypothetical protein
MREGVHSSLLEPNMALLDQFTGFAELFRVVATRPVATRRLDDVPQAAGADYLKLDVQGAELMVLDGAAETLRSVLVVHTEAEFAPRTSRCLPISTRACARWGSCFMSSGSSASGPLSRFRWSSKTWW